MKAPVPGEGRPCPAGRWEIIRYALDSNARTTRLCLMWVVLTSSQHMAAAVAGLLPHIVSRL